ncbi:MAG: O-antigen ligase family protein [Faecousia sp.]
MNNKSWYSERIHIYLAIFLAIQPILDVASYWLQYWNLTTAPMLALRMSLLTITVLAAFLLSRRKRVYWIAAGICLFLAAGHIFACLQEGYLDPIGDLTNFIRVIQMPLLVLCFITFMRESSRAFEGMQLGLSLAFLGILAVEVLSVVTGTDPHTYTYPSDAGILGWFYFANSQSNNLSMLLPLCLAWQLTWKHRRPVLFCATAVLGMLALFFLCTRLAYLGILVTAVGLCITVILIRRSDWKVAVVMALLAVVFAGLVPVSPMYRRLYDDSAFQDLRQGWIAAELGEDQAEVEALLKKKDEESGEADGIHRLTKEERRQLIEDLTPIYEIYVPDFVEIFGAEKTIEMYDYTIDVRSFSSTRAKKLMFAKILMDESGFPSRLFGLELSRFTVGENIYDVENDFHGIYYLYGWVGLGAYLLFIAYFVYLVLWALIHDAKKYFTCEAAGYGIAFLLCMAHAYNTAGVLRRPNASVFLSAVLAGIYYLVKLRVYPEPERLKPQT